MKVSKEKYSLILFHWNFKCSKCSLSKAKHNLCYWETELQTSTNVGTATKENPFIITRDLFVDAYYNNYFLILKF